jgi:hypothetical protein
MGSDDSSQESALPSFYAALSSARQNKLFDTKRGRRSALSCSISWLALKQLSELPCGEACEAPRRDER